MNNNKNRFAILATIFLIVAAIFNLLSYNLFMIDPRVYGTLVWLWQPAIVIDCALQIIMAVSTIVGWLPGIMITAGLYTCSFIKKIFTLTIGAHSMNLLSYSRIVLFTYAIISIVVLTALAKRQKKKPAFIIALSFSFALIAISVASYAEFLLKSWQTFGFYLLFGNFLYFTLTGIGLVFLSQMLWNVQVNIKEHKDH